jgi:hypothetical protein
MFYDGSTVDITHSRHMGTSPGNIKSVFPYKVRKLFYGLIRVVITQELNWPNNKYKSQTPLQNKYKTHAMPERKGRY